MNKTVQLIILIRMHTPSSQLRLVESRQHQDGSPSVCCRERCTSMAA
ncbi:MAG: hypothetical protein HXO27_09305 [Prevotella sp.]|nr:hypothetical protein [Prevotella sp.]